MSGQGQRTSRTSSSPPASASPASPRKPGRGNVAAGFGDGRDTAAILHPRRSALPLTKKCVKDSATALRACAAHKGNRNGVAIPNQDDSCPHQVRQHRPRRSGQVVTTAVGSPAGTACRPMSGSRPLPADAAGADGHYALTGRKCAATQPSTRLPRCAAGHRRSPARSSARRQALHAGRAPNSKCGNRVR